jgi:hypothetical protein
VETAVVVALISAVASAAATVASATFARRTQVSVTELQARRDHEAREEERRSQAKVVLDRYRGPLLDGAASLGGRISNIRFRGFLQYLAPESERKQDAKLTTLFRFANYFGWREVVRTEVQLLRFENEEDTRLVAAFLEDITWILASDQLDDARAMLWTDEQRGIGELMLSDREGTRSLVIGHATFHREYDETFAAWMERFAEDLLASPAASGDRLRLLHWALFGLVTMLDEENALRESDWMSRASDEIKRSDAADGATKLELVRLREHLTRSGIV